MNKSIRSLLFVGLGVIIAAGLLLVSCSKPAPTPAPGASPAAKPPAPAAKAIKMRLASGLVATHGTLLPYRVPISSGWRQSRSYGTSFAGVTAFFI